ncbi:MAG: hypothetical protein OXD37_03390 [Acidimicrobiaceae bacterium]|nr:hypothetical protein [Acidimicrobiaceae bacterium]
MEESELDIEDFRRWALGALAENRNRGIFAEWLVGRALEAIDDGAAREEWMPWDLQYRQNKIEVKASGQAWNPRPDPRFDIACRKVSWDPATNKKIYLDPPARVADVYVFCLHTSMLATSSNVTDPTAWQFWVIPASGLDNKFGTQKTVRPATLDRLARRVEWDQIKEAVDRLID